MLIPSIIARESLMLLSNNTVAASLVFRGDTSNFTGAAVGDTITIRKPANFAVNTFTSSISTQTVDETSVALQLEKHFDISIELTSKSSTLELQDFSRQIIEPAMINMAEAIDTYLYSKYFQISDWNGDGTLSTISDLADLDRALMVKKVPMTGRVGFLSPLTKSRFLSIDNLVRLDTRGDAGLAGIRDASLGRVMNIDWYGAQSVPSQVAGVLGGTPTATGSLASSTVTIASGAASGTFKQGDIVTFAGHTTTYAVQADLTLSSGAGTLTISPALTVAVSGAAVTLKASHACNIVGHPRGISLVSVPLELPFDTEGSNMAAIMNWNGFNIRVARKYDISSKKNIISFDTLVGAKVTDPRLLVRFDG
jgi:hypothetical protein